MPRTPLARLIARMAHDHQAADLLGIDVTRVQAMGAEAVRRELSRRDLLKGAAVLAGAAAVTQLPSVVRPADAATLPRVAVIGAGLSGLAAAMTLKDAGIPCTVYEAGAPFRVGGRVRSNNDGSWAARQVSEWGGELIDSGHATMQALAARFGLPLDDLHAAEPAGAQPTYYFGGTYYPYAQAVQDFKPVWNQLQLALSQFDWPVTWDSWNYYGSFYSRLSAADWINTRVPGGLASKMGKLLDTAYVIEFGAPTSAQTSLNLLGLIGYSNTDAAGNPDPGFQVFGPSDERYHVRGGNDRITTAIYNYLKAGPVPSPVTFFSNLKKIVRNSDGTQTLTFAAGQVATVDHTILTIPLAMYQNGRLDFSQAAFSARKSKLLAAMGMGANAKLQLQFNQRLWNGTGAWPGRSTGESYSDLGYQATWDVTRAQPGTQGILVNYTGGPAAAALGGAGTGGTPYYASSPAVRQYAQSFLSQVEHVYPGITAQWNGQATLTQWGADALYTGGAYSYWPVGYPHEYAGWEGVREHNIHFGGEHCSIDFQGYMEGAANEGIRAAQEVIGDLHA
jgi:monoamine oxidase